MSIEIWAIQPVSSRGAFILFIGIGVTFLLHILFLFEKEKSIPASSEWNSHFKTCFESV